MLDTHLINESINLKRYWDVEILITRGYIYYWGYTSTGLASTGLASTGLASRKTLSRTTRKAIPCGMAFVN